MLATTLNADGFAIRILDVRMEFEEKSEACRITRDVFFRIFLSRERPLLFVFKH
jgi:hypothetical protein